MLPSARGVVKLAASGGVAEAHSEFGATGSAGRLFGGQAQHRDRDREEQATVTSEVRTVDRRLLSDQVYSLVRSRIVGHELAPGTRVVESEVARQLGVSQAPVREALRKLAHEGLVLQFAHRGTFVAEISKDEARDAYRVRAALEGLAAAEFVENGNADVLAAMAEQLDAMFVAARADNLVSLIDHDTQFHRCLWEASSNSLLSRIWPMVEVGMRNFTRISNRLYFGNLEEIAGTHTALLAALRARDRQAPMMFHQHVTAVWDRFERTDSRAANRR